ncbi:MAG: DUF4430 domain-containing protein [Candidatus Nanohaloarchaea archaeon]
MELKTGLDFPGRKDVYYIVAGLSLLLVATLGIQAVSEPSIGEKQSDHVVEVNLTIKKPNTTLSNQVSVKANSTAFQVLNKTYSVKYKVYSFGYFVTSIDGLEQNKTHSWLYYVNGKMPSKSVDNYIIREDVNITYRYSSEKPY